MPAFKGVINNILHLNYEKDCMDSHSTWSVLIQLFFPYKNLYALESIRNKIDFN
jgi:hypothetical protein